MYNGYLIDLDGTIYKGNEKIVGAKEFIETLQKRGKSFLFVTNNTTKTPQEVSLNLRDKFDIHVDKKTIYTASLATLDYLQQQNAGKDIYVIGESGLKDILIENGFIWNEKNPDYVIVGLDRDVSYEKLAIATLAIQNGAKFIGTNPDKNIPTENGLLPGAGSLIASIQTATGKSPKIIGKPESIMMDLAVKHLGLNKSEVIMVGDNYETDIQAGIKNGIDSLLVLTGFTKKEQVPHLPIQPTFVINQLSEWTI